MSTSSDVKNTHLTDDDIKVLVGWIEIPANYESVYGTDGKTTIGGKPKITKSAAFARMAAHLHAETKKYEGLKPRNMQQRWDNYVKKFRDTLKSQEGTGMGLTAEDIEKGLSLPAKLEKMCPCFHRMKKVLGGRSNVKPHATVELGAVLSATEVDGQNHGSVVSDEHVRALAHSFGQDEADNKEPDQEVCAVEPNVPTHPAVCFPGTPASSFPLTIDDELPPNPVVPSCESALSYPQPNLMLKRGAATALVKPVKRAKTNNGKKTSKKTMLTTKDKAPVLAAKTPQPTDSKPAHPSAHETRMSLSQAYAKNAEAKIGFLEAKLEEEKRQWNEKQAVLKQQKVDDIEERRAARRQALLIELIRQNKTPEDIAVFMKLAE